MAGLPHPWDEYESHQRKLSDRSSADDTAWGLEAGLNRIVEAPNRAPRGADLQRVIDSAARRNRYARDLLNVVAETEEAAAERLLDFRSELDALARGVTARDLQVLLASVFEGDGAAAAAASGLSQQNFRKAVSRARARGMKVIRS